MRDDSDGMVSCSFCSGGHDFRSGMRFFQRSKISLPTDLAVNLGCLKKIAKHMCNLARIGVYRVVMEHKGPRATTAAKAAITGESQTKKLAKVYGISSLMAAATSRLPVRYNGL